jgi:predicted nucleic acid-binding protein
MVASVVDASALAALVFCEPAADEVASVLGDTELVAPALLWFEMASVCVTKARRHPADRAAILRAFELAQQVPVQIVDVDHAGVVALAETCGLTAYDAAYLWLARRLRARLVTLDRRLQQLAGQPA